MKPATQEDAAEAAAVLVAEMVGRAEREMAGYDRLEAVVREAFRDARKRAAPHRDGGASG
jgi:hypothetical protein